MYTLLIWDTAPEKIDFYLIPNEVANKYRHFLEEAHNKFINTGEDCDGLKFLNRALSKEKWDEPGFNQYAEILIPFLREDKSPIVMGTGSEITAVYYSGFML